MAVFGWSQVDVAVRGMSITSWSVVIEVVDVVESGLTDLVSDFCHPTPEYICV